MKCALSGMVVATRNVRASSRCGFSTYYTQNISKFGGKNPPGKDFSPALSVLQHVLMGQLSSVGKLGFSVQETPRIVTKPPYGMPISRTDIAKCAFVMFLSALCR